MKWYTCTPIAFKGDHTFFCRDSGAFCRAFQQLGIENKTILRLRIRVKIAIAIQGIFTYWQEQLLATNSCKKVLSIYQTSRTVHK